MHFLSAVASLASVAMAASVEAVAVADVGVDVAAHIGLGNKIIAEVKTDVNAALGLAAGFKCPASMAYSPWLKSCSCAPGLSFDIDRKTCVGTPITGPWPQPKCEATGVTIVLGQFCALTPTKFVKYDPHHQWCQASLDTITFCAEASLEIELAALGVGVDLDVEIEVETSTIISADLRATCAGLAGLYVEAVADAVVLFNTGVFGYGAVVADVQASLTAGIFAKLSSVACFLGLGQCQFDCVSYCSRGCKNYIDVVGPLGGQITGFVGLTILPQVIYIVNSAHVVVTLVVEDLLCVIGRLVKSLLTNYNCGCH